MPVVWGKGTGLNLVDTVVPKDAITLPGIVLAESNADHNFVNLHEGTHFDEWVTTTIITGQPWAWHTAYLIEFGGDLIYYGSLDEADMASSSEKRGYAVSGDHRTTPLIPQDYSFLGNPISELLQ